MKALILDNSAVNSLVSGPDFSRKSEVHESLETIQREGKVMVFALPTNVIEIALCPEVDKRHQIAKRLNELIGGERMLPSFEFSILSGFCRLLQKHFQGAMKTWERVTSISQDSLMPFIALLGEMAALRDFTPRSIDSIILSKLQTTLAQLTIMAEPDRFIPELAKQAEGQEPAKESIEQLAYINKLSISELSQQINDLKGSVVRVRNISKLQKRREQLIQQYTHQQLYETVINCFRYYEDILKTFDFSAIVHQWENTLPVPDGTDVFTRLPSHINTDTEGLELKIEEPLMGKYFTIIHLLCRRYSNGLLPAMYFSIRRFLLELEKNLRDPKSLSQKLIPRA